MSKARHYRDRASEIREIALTCRDPAIKDQLEILARDYEELAERADKNHPSRPKSLCHDR